MSRQGKELDYMKWPLEEFTDAIHVECYLPGCTCSDLCLTRHKTWHWLYRFHWANTEFEVKTLENRHLEEPEKFQCKWVPSYVGLCDIYDRDEPSLSILSIIQRREANPDKDYPETYTEGILKLAHTNKSVGLDCVAPGVNKCQPGASDGISTELRDASRGWGPTTYHYILPVPKLEYPTNKIYGHEWQSHQDDDYDDDDDDIPISVLAKRRAANVK
jgi:hypothetical protein